MSRSQAISDETLFGYLLVALPEAEQSHIDSMAIVDPKLRQRIEDLRILLTPLESPIERYEPSSDLVGSTMSIIQQSTAPTNGLVPDGSNRSASSILSSPMFETDRRVGLAWIDSLVTLAAGIVILSVLLPSVWYSRESSRRTACAENLRELGQALTAFAQGDPEQRLPRIEMNGPLAFAGVYAFRLQDAGLLGASRWVWCPSVVCLDPEQTVPTTRVYLRASPMHQVGLKYNASGNYSYNLGHLANEGYETPKLGGRSHFAVLGDSLLSIGSIDNTQSVHGQNTSNILFEDGHIQSVRLRTRNAAPMIDNPYLNREQKQAVGLDVNDTCLGPSFQNPLKGR